MESKPRGSRKEKVNTVLEDDLGGLFVFSEGKHTELQDEKQREAVVQSPEVIRDPGLDTGRQASEGGKPG